MMAGLFVVAIMAGCATAAMYAAYWLAGAWGVVFIVMMCLILGAMKG